MPETALQKTPSLETILFRPNDSIEFFKTLFPPEEIKILMETIRDNGLDPLTIKYFSWHVFSSKYRERKKFECLARPSLRALKKLIRLRLEITMTVGMIKNKILQEDPETEKLLVDALMIIDELKKTVLKNGKKEEKEARDIEREPEEKYLDTAQRIIKKLKRDLQNQKESIVEEVLAVLPSEIELAQNPDLLTAALLKIQTKWPNLSLFSDKESDTNSSKILQKIYPLVNQINGKGELIGTELDPAMTKLGPFLGIKLTKIKKAIALYQVKSAMVDPNGEDARERLYFLNEFFFEIILSIDEYARKINKVIHALSETIKARIALFESGEIREVENLKRDMHDLYSKNFGEILESVFPEIQTINSAHGELGQNRQVSNSEIIIRTLKRSGIQAPPHFNKNEFDEDTLCMQFMLKRIFNKLNRWFLGDICNAAEQLNIPLENFCGGIFFELKVLLQRVYELDWGYEKVRIGVAKEFEKINIEMLLKNIERAIEDPNCNKTDFNISENLRSLSEDIWQILILFKFEKSPRQRYKALLAA